MELLQSAGPMVLLLVGLISVRILLGRVHFKSEDRLRITDACGNVTWVQVRNVSEAGRAEQVQKLTRSIPGV